MISPPGFNQGFDSLFRCAPEIFAYHGPNGLANCGNFAAQDILLSQEADQVK